MFDKVVSGYEVGSLAGMLKKVKWGVLDNIYNKYDIHYNKDEEFNTNKKRMINELLEKLPEKKVKKILMKLEDGHIQPAQLKKFKRNRDKAIQYNLIRIK